MGGGTKQARVRVLLPAIPINVYCHSWPLIGSHPWPDLCGQNNAGAEWVSSRSHVLPLSRDVVTSTESAHGPKVEKSWSLENAQIKVTSMVRDTDQQKLWVHPPFNKCDWVFYKLRYIALCLSPLSTILLESSWEVILGILSGSVFLASLNCIHAQQCDECALQILLHSILNSFIELHIEYWIYIRFYIYLI